MGKGGGGESPWALVLKKDFGRKFTCMMGIPILAIKTVPRGDSPVVGLCSFYKKPLASLFVSYIMVIVSYATTCCGEPIAGDVRLVRLALQV